jgi:arginase
MCWSSGCSRGRPRYSTWLPQAGCSEPVYGGGVTVVVVPYHQDERLPEGYLPLPPQGNYLVLDPDLPAGDIWRRLTALDDAAADQIAAAVRSGGRITVVSGDCLVGLATLTGAQRAGLDPALVWFDAHGDLHTLETTGSGYLGGLSLRLALGGHADRLAPLGLRPVPESRTILVGARDLDPPEADWLATSGVRRSEIADLDPGALPPGPLVVHVDVDVIDPDELPGLRFPAPGGPPARDVLTAVRRLLDTGRVVALDLACTWNSTLDGRIRQTRAGLLAALLDMP